MRLRGNITDYYISLPQDIQNILNKITDARILVKKLTDFIISNEKDLDSDQFYFMISEIFIEMFEKACIEPRFQEVYAKAIP